MKKLFNSPFICLMIFFLTVFSFWSCTKSNDSSAANSFTLTHEGKTYTANIDSAVTTSMGPFVIIANFSKGLFWRIDMSLTSFNVGTYPFNGGSNNNILRYVDSLGYPTNNAISGSLNVTSNANNRMSGNFTATVKDISNISHTTSGTFTNMPISF